MCFSSSCYVLRNGKYDDTTMKTGIGPLQFQVPDFLSRNTAFSYFRPKHRRMHTINDIQINLVLKP